MKSEKLRVAIEVIGIAAIVASLVFVGLQMKQTHEIALVTLYQMRSDAARELASASLESDALLTIDAKRTAGETLTDYERLLWTLPQFVFFNHFENSHFLYQRGFLSDEQWQSDLSTIRAYTSTQPPYAEYWNLQKQTFRSSFVDAIDASVANNAVTASKDR